MVLLLLLLLPSAVGEGRERRQPTQDKRNCFLPCTQSSIMSASSSGSGAADPLHYCWPLHAYKPAGAGMCMCTVRSSMHTGHKCNTRVPAGTGMRAARSSMHTGHKCNTRPEPRVPGQRPSAPSGALGALGGPRGPSGASSLALPRLVFYMCECV